MILWIESDFISATLSASGNRRDWTDLVKRRLGVGQIKYFHNAMGVVRPEVIIRSYNDTARAHSLRRAARIVRQTYAVKTGNPPQEQIVFGVDNIDAGIASFA
jgi:hypothetical protein